MTNQFPIPPRIPRIVRIPAPAFLRRQSPAVRYMLMAAAAILLLGGLWAAWKWQSLHNGMPKLPSDISELWHANREPAIEFVDANGRTLAVKGPRYGRAIDVKDLPRHVSQASLAAEDKRFYQHDGADEAAIARATFSNVAAGETVSGASTITQQLLKNLVLHSARTMQRGSATVASGRGIWYRKCASFQRSSMPIWITGCGWPMRPTPMRCPRGWRTGCAVSPRPASTIR